MPMSYRVLAFLRRSQFRSRTVPPELIPMIWVCTAPDTPVVQRSELPPDIMEGATAVGGGDFTVCSIRVSLRLSFTLFEVWLDVFTFSLRLVDVDVLVLMFSLRLSLVMSWVVVFTLVLVEFTVDVFTLVLVDVVTLLLLNVCSPLLIFRLVLSDVVVLTLLLVLVDVDVLVLVDVDVLLFVLLLVAVDVTVVSLMLLLVLLLVLVLVTVDVDVELLLVSTKVEESYCAAAVVATNAAVIPAIIFIIDILSAPRLHSHFI